MKKPKEIAERIVFLADNGEGLHPISEGAKLMESYAKQRAKEAELLLIKAIEIIKTWHNADEVWDIYYNHSPEMKEIREWLNQQTKP